MPDLRQHQSVEAIVHQLVRGGELSIDEAGQVWRVGYRRGPRKRLVRVRHRRAEVLQRSGYLVVTRRIGGGQYRAQAHRLVWFHHRGEIPAGLEINHKDGDTANNRLANLELVEHRENVLHAARVLKRGNVLGLTREQVATIRTRRNAGEKLTAIAADFGLTASYCGAIARGERQK